MPTENNKANYNDILIQWNVPEYEAHKRSKRWYIVMSVIGSILILYSISTANFLFAFIIIISTIVIILNDSQKPKLVRVALTDEGILIGKNFYDYDEFKDFSIVYKPKQGIKNLYFEFKNSIKPRISIPLRNTNPLPIRENLLRYLTEDLERNDLPLSEKLAKTFKL